MTPDPSVPALPRIFVSVGTDVHPFPRLVTWVADLARAEPALARWTVQRGWTSAPADLPTSDFLDHADVVEAMSGADLVVCHGGPTTIAEVRRRGRRPLVVPRAPSYGEHVDDHQVLFSRRLAASGLVLLAEDEAAFADLVRRALVEPALVGCGPAEPGGPAAAAAVFGSEVSRLLAEPRPRARWWRPSPT